MNQVRTNITELYVQDNNALEGARTHEQLLDGKAVKTVFQPGEKVKLPFHHAVKYLIDGFTVTDSGDTLYKKPGGAEKDASGAATLGEGEVIAHLRELTNPALLIRANQISGGEKYNGKTKKAVLLNFLTTNKGHKVAKEEKKAAPKSISGEEDLLEGDEMSEDELNKALPVTGDLPTV
jgi:hypothetical protein